ncbi:hypothetical protein PM082_012407 [Marasmius tenuissimus]|nr:hypothetical protein PM082_012407 [Marasmius tenuissimus]
MDVEQHQSMIQESETTLNRINEEHEEFGQVMNDHLQKLKDELERNFSPEIHGQIQTLIVGLSDFFLRQSPFARGMRAMIAQANAYLSFMHQDRIRRQALDSDTLRIVTSKLTDYETIFGHQEERLASLRSLELELGDYQASVVAFERLGVSVRPSEALADNDPILHSEVFARLVAIYNRQAIALDNVHEEISQLNREKEELEGSLQRAEVACIRTSSRKRGLAFDEMCQSSWIVFAVFLVAYAIAHVQERWPQGDKEWNVKNASSDRNLDLEPFTSALLVPDSEERVLRVDYGLEF